MAPTRSTQLLAGIFAVSGTIHLVKPGVYRGLMPKWVPKHREVIIGSGVAELVLAAGLLVPATRKVAGWGSVGLLVGVFPANVQMCVAADRAGNKPLLAGSIARLPLQAPMIKAAYDATRT
ncbi:DoxX family protein [Nocardioides salsibiostraticola]